MKSLIHKSLKLNSSFKNIFIEGTNIDTPISRYFHNQKFDKTL